MIDSKRDGRILIIGSSGALGQHIVDKAINAFGLNNIVISDYKEARLLSKSDSIFRQFGRKPLVRVIDVSSEASVKEGLLEIGIVIIAIQQKKPIIQSICLEKGISSIDLSVDPDFLQKVLSLKVSTTKQSLQLITGGLFPGLSGILAKEVDKSSAHNESVEVGLLQSANGSNGKTGVSDMLRIFDQEVKFIEKDHARRKSGYSYKKKFIFPKPFGTRTLRLANFIERDYLLSKGIKSNYWTSFDREGLNIMISLLKKVGFLKLFKYPKFSSILSSFISNQNKGDHEELIGLMARNSKSEISLIFKSDYEATASCSVAFAKKIMVGGQYVAGVKFPFEVFTFEEVQSDLSDVLQVYEPAQIESKSF